MIKICFKLILLSVFLLGCGQKNEETPQTISTNEELLEVSDKTEIFFEVKIADPEELKNSPDGIIPWISIQDADQEVNQLVGKNEIVVKENRVDLTIDYPLDNPATIELRSDKKSGFTKSELVLKVQKEYKRIYEEEEKTAKTKPIPIGDRKSIVNRNATDGKYGVWGHDLSDLDLSEIIVHRKQGKKTRLELYIES
ncbi:MAG: hypothetical protein K0S23_378 [Fluviicola sp.]|jgi:hypothetical protein|uniref:hypothetical protein n=1 Tax=Fluviicola sp. TaxID=1917219 RepID=UPI0026158A14|nr:hypothetical protein [Fluviicola sp.]MDF3026071.1 hypothetical protein [Fluviicola sp.]